MPQNLWQMAQRGIMPILDLINTPSNRTTARSADTSGQLILSGQHVNQLNTDIEAGLLARDASKTVQSLDSLIHLLELQGERMLDVAPSVKNFTWQTSIARFAAARTQHAILRIPHFMDFIGSSSEALQPLAHRLLSVLAVFAHLTRQHIVEEDATLTPERWLLAPPVFTTMRVNIGIAYYHLSRVLEAGEYADMTALADRDKTFAQNFDIMFYALTYGPLVPGVQTGVNQVKMQHHLDMVENYLQSPQPAIRDDPERFTVSEAHVRHILTTVDRVKNILPRLSV